MRKLIMSLSVVAIASLAIVGASIAFFSDTESSRDNVFAAGAIDLKIDNHSWYNGPEGLVEREDLSWELDDLENEDGSTKLFFNYSDMKPGDWGEDTVSIHVDNNDAWACVDINVTQNDENTLTEPEAKAGDSEDDPKDPFDGELAQELYFTFWIDDGDNVLEDDERVLVNGPASAAIGGLSYALADSEDNNVGGKDGEPLEGGMTYYIGKAWCYGEMELIPMKQDGEGYTGTNGPDYRNCGCRCYGEPVDNLSQSDIMKVDIEFMSTQSRHNGEFVCSLDCPTQDCY